MRRFWRSVGENAAVELVITDDAESAALEAARLLADVASRGGAVALAGGSTPRRAYELAAGLAPDWHNVDVWLGDERCVPPADERSNLRLVQESLVAHLERRPSVHPVPTQLAPVDAAAAYAASLRGTTLDLALLGLGPDGHTASLFPNAPSLEAAELAVAAEAGLEPFVDRVTLTIPALSAARVVAFLVSGQEKAEAARRAFGEPPSPATPASLVRSAAGRTVAILDRAAASELRHASRDAGERP
jgi:6-phosphogluconolactonase